MSNFSYCWKCKAPLKEPSFEEVFENDWVCACGKSQHISEYLKGDKLVELYAKVNDLQGQINSLIDYINSLGQ